MKLKFSYLVSNSNLVLYNVYLSKKKKNLYGMHDKVN